MTRKPIGHIPRVAVIGYGRWGRQCHAYMLRQTEGLELAGIMSGQEEKRRQAEVDLGCRTWATPEEVFADASVDAVVLATPNYTHADLAVAALRAGKHVMTDKVMCLDTAECRRMMAAAEETGRLLTVFQNRRFDGDYLTVKSLLASGRLGELKWLEAAWMGFGVWGGWRGEAAKGGGRIYDLGAHLLDQILLLFGVPVQSVYCRTHHDFPQYDVESEGLIVLTFTDGRTAVMDVSCLATVSKPRFYVRGTQGTFIKYGLDPQEAAMMKGDIDAAVESPENYGRLKTRDCDERIPTVPGRWRSLYENFRDALCGRAESLVTLEEEYQLVEVIEAAKASAVSGQVVMLRS